MAESFEGRRPATREVGGPPDDAGTAGEGRALRAERAPLERIWKLGSDNVAKGSVIAVIGAILAHVAVATTVFIERSPSAFVDAASARSELWVMETPPPAPEIVPEVPEPPPPAPAPPVAKALAHPQIAPAREAEDESASAPAPEAAQASALLTADPEEDDAYSDTFVTGDADKYAGGQTAHLGTSIAAVYGGLARAGGVPGGTGSGAPEPTGPDRSRRAHLGPEGVWDCDFPGEADVANIDHAIVKLAVNVRPNGTAESVEILVEPGHGFGRMARSCALRQKFTSARDREGHAIGGRTPVFSVTFSR